MEVYITLEGESGKYNHEETVDALRKHFRVPAKNPNSRYKYRFAIPPSGKFKVGMWKEIEDFVEQNYPDATIRYSTDFKKVAFPAIRYRYMSSIDNYVYRDYQLDAVDMMFKAGRGVVLLPTASGKTLVMGGFCKTYLDHYPKSRIFINVPSVTLLRQTYGDFVNDYGIGNVTRWGGQYEPDFDKPILIASSQILFSDIKYSIRKLKNYDVFIGDEIHRLKKGNEINKIVHNIDTPNKFGLTGTLPNDLFDTWNVYGRIGPVIAEKKSHELREDGSIANVEVKIIRLVHKGQPKRYVHNSTYEFRPTGQYENEIEFLYNSEWRNDFIVDMSSRLKGNVLVLVDRILHGEILRDKLEQKTKKDVQFICGDTEEDDRELMRVMMEDNNDIVCVAMDKIFSTGISIKNLKYVVFVCIGKSQTKILQSIGRSLRLHSNKERAYIFDVSDYTEYSCDHLNERINYYRDEKIDYEIRKIKER